MRPVGLILCAVVVAACGPKAEQPAMDTTAVAPPPPPPAPAPITLADVAGRWTVEFRAEGSDSVLVTSELVATADTTGWQQILPNRTPTPVRVVAVSGDSIVTAAGPFKSALRKGVDVTTESVMRLQGGQLVGTTVAHYKTSKPDSVLRLRTTGTRKQ